LVQQQTLTLLENNTLIKNKINKFKIVLTNHLFNASVNKLPRTSPLKKNSRKKKNKTSQLNLKAVKSFKKFILTTINQGLLYNK